MTEPNRVIPFQRPRLLSCTQCGAEANAACDCVDPIYALAPGERAARAVAAHPDRSDRAIASEIGVSHPTVRRARQSTGTNVPVERTGRDGRTRRQPTRIPAADVMPTEAEAEESEQEALLDHTTVLLEQMSTETRQEFFTRCLWRMSSMSPAVIFATAVRSGHGQMMADAIRNEHRLDEWLREMTED